MKTTKPHLKVAALRIANALVIFDNERRKRGMKVPDLPECKDEYDLAKRYIWWETAEEAVANNRTMLVTQVMNLGILEDILFALELWPDETFLNILKNPPCGIFNEERWSRWHEHFGLPIPPLPVKRIPTQEEVDAYAASL